METYPGEENSIEYLDDVRLEPNEHHEFVVEGYVKPRERNWEPACRLEVWYYDPRRGKRMVVKDRVRQWPWTKVHKKEEWED